MPTQLQPPAALVGRHGPEQPMECPTCGQPLLDHEALERVEHARREMEKQLDEAVRKRAEPLAKQIAAKERQAAEQRIESLTQLLASRAGEIDKLKSSHSQALAQEKKARRDELKRLRASVMTEAVKTAETKVLRKLRQKDKLIEYLKEQHELDERKIERLTSDERGEMNEEELVACLQMEFPDDRVERRGRGRAGSDILHEIRYRAGSQTVVAGLIVYECKDTLQWANEFLGQAKKARVTHRTPHVVIVSRAFPRNEKHLCVRDEVPIVAPTHLVAFGRVLRAAVIELHRASLTSEGQVAKTQELYEYLSGTEFRQEFDAVLDGPRELTDLLGKEREAHERMWAKRSQIHSRMSGGASAVDGRIRAIIERGDEGQAEVLPLERSAAS